MTRQEWEAAREANRPNTAQSNFTRASGSEAVRNMERLEFLFYGVKIVDFEDPRLYQRHRAVIAKALAEGKPVPAAVLAEYPELATAGGCGDIAGSGEEQRRTRPTLPPHHLDT